MNALIANLGRGICRSFALITLAIAATVGCAPSGENLIDVAGTVSIDGAPIETGDIVFRSVDGRGRSYAGKIMNGQFAFQTSTGSKKVEITGYRRNLDKIVYDNGIPEGKIEMIVPAKYNAETELRVDLTDDGETNFEFGLER